MPPTFESAERRKTLFLESYEEGDEKQDEKVVSYYQAPIDIKYTGEVGGRWQEGRREKVEVAASLVILPLVIVWNDYSHSSMYPLHSSVGPVSSCEENTAGYLVWNVVAAVNLISWAFKSIDVLEMINRKESLQYLSYACSTWNMPPKFFSLSKNEKTIRIKKPFH